MDEIKFPVRIESFRKSKNVILKLKPRDQYDEHHQKYRKLSMYHSQNKYFTNNIID